MQQKLESVTWWCHDTEFFINPDEAHGLWCTLDKRPADKPMPAVTFDGAVAEEKKSSEIRWDPFQKNADLQRACGNNSTEVHGRSVSPEGHGCKGYLLDNATSSCCIKVWCSVLLTLN